MQKVTYKNSGVDIQAAGIFKGKIKTLVKSSFRPEVLKGIGGFGSFFRLDTKKYKHPILVSSSDGVGTKLKIAGLAKKHDTVGIDAVAMNVNDILCTGAEPLFFLDYIAYSKLGERELIDVVKGINAGCIESNCSLIGGETAQMPGMYAPGEYDIAGFCVGVVERDKVIDGSQIRAGNLIIGLESNGLHSNGYSLVRKVLTLKEQKRMSQELLRPTRIYVKQVLGLLNNKSLAKAIRGISHITGGAFYDKIARILPDNLDASIQKDSWRVPEIFRLVQHQGKIEEREMYHTLNMGIGLVLVVDRASAASVIAELKRWNQRAWVIGEIIKGKKEVKVV